MRNTDLMELLSNLRAASPRSGNSHTVDIVLEIADRIPYSMSKEQENAIKHLARKVDIQGKVYASYDPTWAKRTEEAAMMLDAWPLLIALFLYQAGCHPQPELSLKWLNTAFNAIDVYKKHGGVKHLEGLVRHAEDQLNSTV